MARINSIQRAPDETRTFLRNRFMRFLPTVTNTRYRVGNQTSISDVALAELLKRILVERGNDEVNARALYESLAAPDEETFIDLLEVGQFSISWGRIRFWRETYRVQESRARSGALEEVYKATFTNVYRLSTESTAAHLLHVIDKLNAEKENLNTLVCQTPSWVAVRMWEHEWNNGSRSELLRRWVDHWIALGRPVFPLSRWLNDEEVKYFSEEALKIIRQELPDEEATWDIRCKRYRIETSGNDTGLPSYFPRFPVTLVDRVIWLLDPQSEQFLFNCYGVYDDVLALARVLCDEIDKQDYARAPHPLTAELCELATNRPILLFALIQIAKGRPRLLADMLLVPKFAAATCVVIANWTSPSSAWHKELRETNDASTRQYAFEDGISVVAHFLASGSLPFAEIASLWAWLHKKALHHHFNRIGQAGAMLCTLRQEMAKQAADHLVTMAHFLINQPTALFGSFEFSASVDILHTGRLEHKVNASIFIDRYVDAFSAEAYKISAEGISSDAAAALVEMVIQQSELMTDRFLYPVSVQDRLIAITPTENEFTVKANLASYVRAHIRILARAILGWRSDVPAALINALADALETGGYDCAAKGKISAFAPSFEHGLFIREQRPIAADIGLAIGKLGADKATPLLAAVLETDEPLLLVDLLRFTRSEFHEELKKRIKRLTPSRAARISSLPESQARIDAMLSAGLASSAELYIQEEEGAKTYGRVQGRAVTRLQASLRLRLLREDWNSIDQATPPPDLDQAEQESALNLIRFFKAIGELKRPGGTPAVAERIFWDLRRHRGDIISYSVNWFAAKTSTFLANEIFGSIDREQLAACHSAISQGEEFIVKSSGASDADKITFHCNQSLLLLALGEPQQVIDLLTPLQYGHLSDSVTAYLAIALSRVDRQHEALAVLAHVELHSGYSQILDAAREHIATGARIFGSSHMLEDRTRHIKAVMFEFTRLDHSSQAAILQPSGNLIIDFVRQASSAMMSLVPMMKGVRIDSCEDDLNALLRELLLARMELLQWSASDQSKGGYTARGNPGERDLVLRKGSHTLAVIEAVVCRHSFAKQDLAFHFEKLLSYDTCALFIHLTYSFIGRSSEILEFLKQTAQAHSQVTHQYIEATDIRFDSSGPIGFVAEFQTDRGKIHVAFLVLDLGQHSQQEAAIQANARKRVARLKGIKQQNQK